MAPVALEGPVHVPVVEKVKPKRVRPSRAKPKVLPAVGNNDIIETTQVETQVPISDDVVSLNDTDEKPKEMPLFVDIVVDDVEIAEASSSVVKTPPRKRAPAKPRPSRTKAVPGSALGSNASIPQTKARSSQKVKDDEENNADVKKNVTLPFSVSNPRENFIRYLLKQPSNQLAELQVRDIEIGIFNWSLDKAEERRIPRNWNNSRFLELYNSKARSVAANLTTDSYVGNDRLASRITDEEFIPHEVVTMTADRVCPERWQKVIEAKIRHDEYISTAKPTAMTDQFLCGRCKKRECSFMELQTRSCDEPASIFVCCLSCGHRWRMG